jgi:ABC-2 type transport system ATP-binding protein
MNIIEAAGLGKRYRGTWALRDCSLAIPEGAVVALVGHNGAGKTTLMNLLAGLIEPTEGTVSVLGGLPAGSPAALDAVGYVAQEAPLYQNLTAGETLRVIGSLNRRWDQRAAEARLAELGIPLSRRVRKMSGGMQAQLALTVALARRPRLLVLDEPLAMLDPLARFDFMDTVMTAASREGMSVLLSSHVLADLERVADYLILLSGGRLRVAGSVPALLAGHRVLTGPDGEAPGREAPGGTAGPAAAGLPVVRAGQGDGRVRLLVSSGERPPDLPEGWQDQPATLEEMVLGYLREPGAPASPAAAAVTA